MDSERSGQLACTCLEEPQLLQTETSVFSSDSGRFFSLGQSSLKCPSRPQVRHRTNGQSRRRWSVAEQLLHEVLLVNFIQSNPSPFLSLSLA